MKDHRILQEGWIKKGLVNDKPSTPRPPKAPQGQGSSMIIKKSGQAG